MFDPLTQELERLADATPSSRSMARLEELREVGLTSRQRMLVAKAWDRLRSATQAASTAAQLEAVTPTAGSPTVEVLEAELALILRRSDPAMLHQLWLARSFADRAPETFTRLARGEAEWGHLACVEDLTATVPVETARQIGKTVAGRAATMTVAAFRRMVRKAVAAADPDALARRHRRAKEQAGVRLRPEADGMASLHALLPAPDAMRAMAALNARADASRTPDDDRTHGQRQIAALVEALDAQPAAEPVAEAVADADAPPAEAAVKPGRRVLRRRRAEIGVVIGWRELLGLREGAATLDGHGPIPAQTVRDMIAEPDTTLRRIVVDDLTGDLLDYTVTTYTPDTRLRELLAVRDVTCRYPGCTRPAWACDCEHRDTHAGGGTTSTVNNCLFCRKHHNRKTHDGFTYTRTDPATGEIVLETPLGFRYRQHATTYDDTGPDLGDTTRVPHNDQQPPPDPDPPPDTDDPPF